MDVHCILIGNCFDLMLDVTDFFEDDSGAAEYYMALEMAVEPMRSITEDLKKRFRTWIERLEIGANDRPQKHYFMMIRFFASIYAEFVESL